MNSASSTDPHARPTPAPGTAAPNDDTVFSAADETVFSTAAARTSAMTLNPEVALFCQAHNLGHYVDATVYLARDAFPGAKAVTLRVEGEPGGYGQRLILDVTPVAAEGERQYRDFVRRWIGATPPWVTDRMGVALTYEA